MVRLETREASSTQNREPTHHIDIDFHMASFEAVIWSTSINHWASWATIRVMHMSCNAATLWTLRLFRKSQEQNVSYCRTWQEEEYRINSSSSRRSFEEEEELKVYPLRITLLMLLQNNVDSSRFRRFNESSDYILYITLNKLNCTYGKNDCWLFSTDVSFDYNLTV